MTTQPIVLRNIRDLYLISIQPKIIAFDFDILITKNDFLFDLITIPILGSYLIRIF
jgi:hypothetical protein